MKILITGATGLVGNAIVKECHRNHIDVHYLTTSKNKISTELNYKGFYWNPESLEIDVNCFEGVEAIINLAGASISKRWTTSYKKEIVNSRINSLKTLHKGLNSANTATIRSFISASAIGIYPSSINKLYEEDHPLEEDGFLSMVVNAWEKEVNTFDEFNFNIVKIRIGLVLSDDGGALPEMAKPIKFFVGSAYGSGEQWQSWIHIKDLARLFLFAIQHELAGIYNGVASNPVTNKKLVAQIGAVLGKPTFFPKVPSLVLKTILGEMAELLLSSQRVSNKKILNEGFVFKFENVSAALASIYKK